MSSQGRHIAMFCLLSLCGICSTGLWSIFQIDVILDIWIPMPAAGEKAQLRRERITAKRAARAAGRGFDLAWVNKELQDLVGRRGDMKVGACCAVLLL